MAAVQQRPRTSTMASMDSKWSHRSRKSSSENKMDLTELPKDKLKITGKADPSRALTELQPAAEALQESTLGNLRKESFTGRDGLPIQEPDASNPGRYRWERPLQTIAGFEADIDRTYREKGLAGGGGPSTYGGRPQSRGDPHYRGESRRNSYFPPYNQNGSQAGGYYRNTYDSNEDSGYSYGPNGNSYGNARGSRGYSDSGYGSKQSHYPGPGHNGGGEYQPPYQNPYQHSYRETASASPETDQMNFSTGPSSYNSSYDQVGGPHAGPGGKALPPAPIPESGNSQMPPPDLPQQSQAQAQAQPRAPMKLNTGVDQGDGGYEQFNQRRRSSWFKRRFSKEEY